MSNFDRAGKPLSRACVGLFVFLAIVSSAHGQLDRDSRNWEDYGGGPDHSKYVDLKQITKANVSKLEVAWTYSAGDEIPYMFNPVVVDGVMYVLAKNNSLIALDAATGKELWIHAHLDGIIKRGINYWESDDRNDRRLIFSMNNRLQAIDARTGKSILTFGDGGSVSLKEGLGRDPATIGRIQSTTPGHICGDRILIGSSPGENLFSAPGHLRAYNVVTGKLEWVFHTVPHPGEFGHDTWPQDAYKYVGGTNVWGEISVDEKRGIAYFPLGSPTYDYYGADRAGSNLFGNCLLALDVQTGKRLWHFQTVHHDLWDYDLTAAPQLLTVRHEGKEVDVVAAATKQGFVFVFDRVTGEPLWPIEEREVPPSTMPGEKTWPTQPFPTVPPPFNRQNVTVADLNPHMAPDKLEAMKKRVLAARTGLFQPPSDKYETVSMPGAVGGANFGNTAADPSKGLLFVATQEYPSIYKLSNSTEKKESELNDRLSRGQSAYQQNCLSCHGAERTGAAGPTLIGVGEKIAFPDFQTLMSQGRGQMPGFPHLDERSLASLYTFLGGRIENRGGPDRRRGQNETPRKLPAGPVVASGGAPVADEPPMNRLDSYPTGVTPPADLYTTDYGLQFSDLLSPPWSYIVAYDLNEGVIKWKSSLGHDPRIPKPDGKNLGLPIGSQRKGMIVTSTGLLFATSKGGQLHAYDAGNGDLLWTVNLSRETEGLPAMYEADGRQFLIVGAMAPLGKEMGDRTKEGGVAALPAGYVVFSLPDDKNSSGKP